MLRVVLDTNVVVSALLFRGPPKTVYELALANQLVIITSPPLVEELRGVLVSKFDHPPEVAKAVAAEYSALSVIVEPTVTLLVVHDDLDDNRVLECAVSAQADAIVSGDRHLLKLQGFRGIPILTPHAFLDRWSRRVRV